MKIRWLDDIHQQMGFGNSLAIEWISDEFLVGNG